jgi:glycosyltransferase involved in cell wall biosynthesis
MSSSVQSSDSVSVVIPTYNRADLVVRALESVVRQTLPPLEILVVDDGSTDGTAERIAGKFPEVEVVRQDNRGVSAARNAGIRQARGEWIALLDSDDEWAPIKLERQMAALGSGTHRICHCDEIWIRNGKRVNPGQRHAKPGGWIYRDCLPLCAISPSAVLLHQTVLAEVGLFDESLPVCEDYDLWLRITSRYPVLFLDELLVTKYGGHDDQLSTSLWGMDRFRVKALQKAWRTLALASSDRIATLEVLVEKLEILLAGARKRDRAEMVAELELQLPHFHRLLLLERMAA